MRGFSPDASPSSVNGLDSRRLTACNACFILGGRPKESGERAYEKRLIPLTESCSSQDVGSKIQSHVVRT